MDDDRLANPDVAPEEQGRGVATTAVAELCRMAFEQAEVTQVVAETAVGNVPSQRVLEKVGFVRVGTRDTVVSRASSASME